jgi:hypothetical protein
MTEHEERSDEPQENEREETGFAYGTSSAG